MPTARASNQLNQRPPFAVAGMDLTGDPLLKALKMTTLDVTAKRDAKIKKEAAKAGIKIGPAKVCLSSRRCHYGSCHMCRRLAQEDFVRNHAPLFIDKAWRKLVPKLSKAKRAQAITIVPACGKLPVGGDDMTLRRFIQWIRNLLKRYARNARGIFWVEVSWNVSEEDRRGYWQLHVHGVIWKLSERAKARLRKALKRDADEGDRPLKVTRLRTAARWLAYISKPNSTLRKTTIDKRGNRDTKDTSLTLEQEVAVARWLSFTRADARFFTVGLGPYSPSSTSISL